MSSRYYSNTTMVKNKVFNLRMPDDLRQAVEQRAKQRFRSINNEIVILLKLGLANEVDESVALKSADTLLAQTGKRKKKNA